MNQVRLSEREPYPPFRYPFLTYTLRVCMLEAMNRGASTMHQRVNITLPEETLRLIDRVATKGDRSRFIDSAVKHYVDAIGRASLRKQLKEGAIRRAQRDLNLAQEWFALEEEVWQGKQK